jgi:SAM-dependent methyltransferase
MSSRYRAIAEYYDAEYADTRLLQEDVPFFLDHLPRRRKDVLELCVGTARAAIPIAQAGHRVVGVDYDQDLLAIGRRKRDSVGLTDRELDLQFGDALKLNLGRRFDWVCIFFNTLLAFPTLDELDQLLGTVVRGHLKPNGRLWFDIFNPDLNLLVAPRSARLDPHVFHVPALDRTVYSTTDIRRNLSAQTQEVTFGYAWFDPAGRKRTERNRFTMTWLFPRELALLLDRNGLTLEHLYGNYDGSDVTDGSPRLIGCCRAKKPKHEGAKTRR